MDKYGEILEGGSMKFVREFPGTLERAWSWIAEAEKRARWLCGGDDIAHAGQIVKFAFLHENLTPHDEVLPEKYKDMAQGVEFEVRVVKCAPPHHVTFEWPGARGEPSIVEIDLEQHSEIVRLTLRQKGDINADELIAALAGWHTHFAIMIDKMAGAPPKPFWSVHAAYAQAYEKRLAE